MRILGTWKSRWVLAGAALLFAMQAHVAKAQDATPIGTNLLSSSSPNAGFNPNPLSPSSFRVDPFDAAKADFVSQPVLLPSLAMAAPRPESNPSAYPAPPTNDYLRWEVEAGAVFTRFRSSIYYASMFGFRAGVGYHLNDWLTAEGGITTGFAPEIFANEHVKYIDYMGGVRVGPRRDRFSPWVHAEIGGAHILPQTAGDSSNSFAVKAGIGLEYKPFYSVSVRAQADWLHTQFFGESQENVQGSIGLVFHF